MPEQNDIQTPFAVRLKRIQRRWLPVAVFLAVSIASLALLKQQTGTMSIVGEVESFQTTVTSPADGMLLPASSQLGLFDAVSAGQVIGRLDVRPTQESLEADLIRRGRTNRLYAANTLRTQVGSTEIRCPVRGKITSVYAKPGQWVQEGDPIVTITDGESECYVTAYVRQHRRTPVRVGMPVEVRPSGTSDVVIRTSIKQVGPAVTQIPDDLQNDPSSSMRGLPIRVPIPPEANLRPGEIVSLTIGLAASSQGS